MTNLSKKTVALGVFVALCAGAAYIGISLWNGGRYTSRAAAAAMLTYATQTEFRFPNLGESPIRLAPNTSHFVDSGFALVGNTVVLRNEEHNVTIVVFFARSDKGYQMKACTGFPSSKMPTDCK